MALITFWHNPRCSKSRAALAMLEGRDVEVRRYLDDAPGEAELRAAHAQLGGPVIAMMRTGEAAFRQAGLTKDSPEDALFAAMAAHPILIERPLAMTAGRAVIGRPPEAVLALLDR
ncbi:arsenate reductase (glutaredoxin) [Roseovarius aquimarinus]|uniref:Arsenate reductase n=1 Tax=Roseovarius aquimarinus TaxID=1229156 RepID=A0ABW7I9B7_9RHOB